MLTERLGALGAILLALSAAAQPVALHTPLTPLTPDAYNLIWTTPSTPTQGAAGSMPIGNGETGLNVWVEEGGDLLFYIARTDAWSETDRLLKLGRVRVAMSPNPFAKGLPFRQELVLREGRIEIAAGLPASQTTLRIFVNAAGSDIHIEGDSKVPITITSTLENWRTEKKSFENDDELRSSWTMHSAPEKVRREIVWESADALAPPPPPPPPAEHGAADAVTWYHRNEHSIVPFTLKHQGLDSIKDQFADPLLHRTFGGRMSGRGMTVALANPGAMSTKTPVEGMNPRTPGGSPVPLWAITTKTPVKDFAIRITTHAAQTPTLESWLIQLAEIDAKAGASDGAMKATSRWWHDFWDRSFIEVSPSAGSNPKAALKSANRLDRDPAPASRITQAYMLQRWVAACGGRQVAVGDGKPAAFPIKFNGSIFTVEPKHTEGQPFNPDWRKWGGCFWWQNTRLPYYSMLAAGDFDMMEPLFQFYEAAVPGCKARAKLYHDAEGVYFPETMTSFGAYSNGDYGWDRTDAKASDIQCPWWQWTWQQNLELAQLMLDRAAYTGDERFLKDRAIPMANEALRYFDSRFKRDGAGKLEITPTQAAETYWEDVVNDAPTVGGLHAVCDMLLALPGGTGTVEDRVLWSRIKGAAPALPVWTVKDLPAAAPAEKFKNKRSNCEAPELYPLWPFRCYGLGKPNIDHAINAYNNRSDRSTVGWTQDGMFAAMLGLTDEAKANLLAKTTNSNPKFRFPAMWGPNFDWLPDQCHGSNLMSVLQLMLLQCDGDTIRVLPAWPRDWDVSFKLHAPRRTIVEVTYRGGRIERLVVTPESRRGDVQSGVSLPGEEGGK